MEKLTFKPGRRVKEPLSFISAPETLSPIVAWRLCWTPVAWTPWEGVVLVVLVVVVVVVVAGARRAVVARVVRPPPRSLVFRLGRAVVRVGRVVRGAVRRIGMLIVWLLVEGFGKGLEFWRLTEVFELSGCD